jgi:hypothetical protein
MVPFVAHLFSRDFTTQGKHWIVTFKKKIETAKKKDVLQNEANINYHYRKYFPKSEELH